MESAAQVAAWLLEQDTWGVPVQANAGPNTTLIGGIAARYQPWLELPLWALR